MGPRSDSAGAPGTWLERSFGVTALRLLTAAQAREAVQALFTTKARRKAAACNEEASA